MSGLLGNFAGLRVIFSNAALADTDVRNFPISKHRSRRIHKKLVKRFGGEFRKEPAMFKTPHGIVAHPSFATALRAITEAKP